MTKSLGEGGSPPWLGCSCILAHKGKKSTSYPWVSTPQLPAGYAEVAGSTYSGMARIWTRLQAKKWKKKAKQFFSLTFKSHVSSHGQSGNRRQINLKFLSLLTAKQVTLNILLRCFLYINSDGQNNIKNRLRVLFMMPTSFVSPPMAQKWCIYTEVLFCFKLRWRIRAAPLHGTVYSHCASFVVLRVRINR